MTSTAHVAMTIFRDIDEALRLMEARTQPGLSFLSFSLADLQREVHASLFPEIECPVAACFVSRGPLACITNVDSSAVIYLHQLFNHPETPREVLAFVLTHEFLHLRIAPRMVGQRMRNHPPEFWAAERALSPTRTLSWSWIWRNYFRCLKRRPKLERIDVTGKWKQVWNKPRITSPEFAGPQHDPNEDRDFF